MTTKQGLDDMLNPTDRKIAAVFKERLIQAGIPVQRVVVYGSRARGDFTSESDLDVCLVVDAIDDQIGRTISRIAWEVGYQLNRIITTVEYTPEQLERTPLRSSPFVRAIQQQGVPV